MAREMKDSGIEWIGEVPKEWAVPKIMNRFNLIGSGTTPRTYEDNYYADGEINWIQSGDLHDKYLKTTSKKITQIAFERTSALKMYFPKYLVMAMYGASVGNLSIATIEACTNQACCVLAGEKDNLTYMYYVLMAAKEYLIYSAVGGTQPNISQDVIKNLRIPIPMIVEQQRIVDVLDKEFAELDSVLEKSRASIEEYKKLKQSVITQAVTKGIRGNREMKDSQSTWFGQIPSDWKMRKIKYIFKIQKDIAGEEGHTVLSITQKGIKPKDLSKNEGQLAENYSNYQLVHIGDFAMNHMDLLTGWVDVSKYEGVTSPDYRVFGLIDKDNYCSQYYLYLMQMCYTNRIFYGLGQGVSGLGRWRLQADKFLNFSITVPSYQEQKEIAYFLDQKCLAIDELISKKEQYLSEIENYKKSLIYEYVTGKKEVPQE